MAQVTGPRPVGESFPETGEKGSVAFCPAAVHPYWTPTGVGRFVPKLEPGFESDGPTKVEAAPQTSRGQSATNPLHSTPELQP